MFKEKPLKDVELFNLEDHRKDMIISFEDDFIKKFKIEAFESVFESRNKVEQAFRIVAPLISPSDLIDLLSELDKLRTEKLLDKIRNTKV